MNPIQEAMLVVQFLEVIVTMVQKVAALLPDTPGTEKAKAVADYVVAMDARLTAASPQLMAGVEWAYKTFVAAKAAKATGGNSAAVISVVGAVANFNV